MTQIVHVAVGVIIGTDGRVLIAKRPQNTHQGGLWEFPGGKVAPGESVQQALARELHEELALHVEASAPFVKIQHDYGDKTVLLDIHKVTRFSGTPCGNEGQPIRWVDAAELLNYPFPAANRAIVTALVLPDRMLITGVAPTAAEYLQRIEHALNHHQIRLVQLRCPDMTAEDYQALAHQVQALCATYNARLLLNTTPTIFSVVAAGGLHLNRHQLLALSARPVDTSVFFGASCHNAQEILQAKKLGVDYLILSPVAETTSHPEAQPLGWDAFTKLATTASVPVFALGGMQEKDLPTAQSRGAHGIAAISCWW
jgi:8-oxo-dGTP diphosphatase